MSKVITLKLEVVELEPEWRKIWYGLAQEVQELTNFVWRHWEAYHTNKNSSQAIRDCLARNDKWKEKSKEERQGMDRPKWTVDAWPKEFANNIYHRCTKRFPGVSGRVIVLALQKIRGNVVGKKSAGSNLKWWIAILLDRDSRGTSLHPQPIPFDKANSKLREADEKGRIELVVRTDRVVKTVGKNGRATEVVVRLKTGGKRWQYADLAHRAAKGEIAYRGSQLTYDWRKKKWFCCLVVDKPAVEPVELDPEKMLIVRPGKNSNWRLRYGGRTWTVGGRGRHVANVRKGLLMQRWSRQEGYRHAPRRKGRGLDRALAPLFKLSNRWNSFTRRMNDATTAWIVDWCKQRGVGTVVLVGGHPSRMLATAGKVEGREDSTGWPWHQMEQLLQQKANRVGVRVDLRSFSGGKNERKSKVAKKKDA